MKKITLLASGFLISALSVYGQVVEQKQTALMAKKTATWCGPCGTWGWTLFDDVYAARKSTAVIFELHNSSSSQLFTSAGSAMYSNFESHNTTPVFYVNGKNETQYSSTGGIYPSTTTTRTIFVIDSIAALSPVVNSGSLVNVSSTSIDVTTKTKFFEQATGEYYLGIYVTENDVIKYQNGIGNNAVHKNPLRGSLFTNHMGELLVNGTAMAGQEFSSTATMPIAAGWDPSKLQVFTVIWKKVGTKYEYVNASKGTMLTASGDLTTTSFSAVIYPTVATSAQPVTLRMETTSSEQLTILTYDQLGRTVQIQNQFPAIGDAITVELNRNHSLAPGAYFVTTSQGNSNRKTLKFVVLE